VYELCTQSGSIIKNFKTHKDISVPASVSCELHLSYCLLPGVYPHSLYMALSLRLYLNSATSIHWALVLFVFFFSTYASLIVALVFSRDGVCLGAFVILPPTLFSPTVIALCRFLV